MSHLGRKLAARRGKGGGARRLRQRSNPLSGDLGALVEVEVDASYPSPKERPSGDAWDNNPFGPFADPRDTEHVKALAKERLQTDDVIDHDFSAGIDLRGLADFTTIFRKDSSAFNHGTIQIDVTAVQSAAQVGVESTNYAEIRIVAFIAGTPYVVCEQAAASHSDLDEELSSGAVRHTFEVGEVPDRFEVQARARQGGAAETAQNADESLSASITSRFHR